MFVSNNLKMGSVPLSGGLKLDLPKENLIYNKAFNLTEGYIDFPEIVGNDIFDVTSSTFWKSEALNAIGSATPNNRRFYVRDLIVQERILSFMQGYSGTPTTRPAIFSYVKDGALKRLVAYSAITEANGEKVLSAFKDTVTDFGEYAFAFNERTAKLDAGGQLASDGENVDKIMSESSGTHYIQTTDAKRGTLLLNGAIKFGTASVANAFYESSLGEVNYGKNHTLEFKNLKLYSMVSTNALIGSSSLSYITINTSGSVLYRTSSTATTIFATNLVVDTTYNLKFVRNESILSLYVNGVLFASETITNNDFKSRYLGSYDASARLRGELAEFKRY